KLLDDTDVTLFQGHATIVDAHTVAVGEQRITARHILIATGGRPMRPDVPGGELGIVSDDFFHLPALPQNAIVVGGGYIAVELASILNGLGSKVTLVHRSAQLLRGMDADLGVFLAKEMEKKGITVRLDMQIASITAQGGTNDEKKRVTLKNGETIDADCILFATGRQPNVEGMGLDEAGVQRDERGAVVVDADFRTSVPSIYAVGDVIDRVALTPVALAEGMVVASALFGDGKRAVSYDNIPTAVFSHPNVGTVGLSEDEARRRHGTLRIYKSEFRALKSTISGSSERVLMKLVVDEASDRVLGVHLVGPDAGEIVQGFAVALNSGATKAQFDATIGVHPTLAEEFVTMRTPV
ncbi:MAG TPA: FAD-dependent oxidoreductase, partial [Oxalicibacterium sp.]